MTGRVGSDAELVMRARQGEAQAFDSLVLRHRAHLYEVARGLTRGHEAAEDVVQEALLRAYRALPSLRDGERFGPWAAAIVRREGLRWLRGGPRERVPLEAVTEMVGGASVASPEVPEEITDLIAQALQTVSQRHRTVLTQHYLEGRSLQEIAAGLGVTEGRVKRLLFDSRQAARKRYAMADQERKGPRPLGYWSSGSVPYGEWDYRPVLTSALAQTVCLAVNKQPKTVAQLAAEVESHPAYVQETVERLTERELLVSPRRHTYLLNFIALDAEDWRRLVARVRQPAGELARRLTEAQPRLHGAFARTPLAAAGWTWEDVVWVLHALLIGNRGLDLPAEVDAELVGEAAAGPLLAPERPGGGHYWLGGHESGPDVPAMEAPGWYGTARGDWELGHFGPGRGHAGHTWIFAPPAHGLAVLRALLEGPRPEEEVIAQCGLLEREQCRATLAELVQAGLAEREGERFRLTFPVFGPGDTEVLSAPLREVTRPLLEEVLLPTWADLAALFDELGYRHCREQYVIWRHWLSALIVGEALRFLVRQGTLPELGETPPAPWSYAAAWGTTLWR